MGSPTFDRQVFVKKTPQRPPRKSPLPGAFALLVVAALASFATYRYVKAGGGTPSNSADKAQITQLQKKVKAAQARVEELEKRRHVSHVSRLADNAKPERAKTDAPKPSHTLPAKSVTHPVNRSMDGVQHSTRRTEANNDQSTGPEKVSHPPVSKTSPEKLGTTKSKTLLASAQQPSNKELNLLRSDLAANNDQWQATVNRLGNVVGELDSQRSALKKNQTNVNYLMGLAHRTSVPFTLKKGRTFQRVGPVSMRLTATSVKEQHYNIRLIVDDKSVELKDRALNEVVQFYTSQSKFPLELIVSQINKDEVSGTLAIPQDLSEELSNTQPQEK